MTLRLCDFNALQRQLQSRTSGSSGLRNSCLVHEMTISASLFSQGTSDQGHLLSLSEFDLLLCLIFTLSILIGNLTRFVRLKEKHLAQTFVRENPNRHG